MSVHDIYSSAFYLALCFFVFILSPLHLPNIILCHSQRENLIALTNKVSWDRQQLQGMMLHKDSEREAGRHTKNNDVKSGRHRILHSQYLLSTIPGWISVGMRARNWWDCTTFLLTENGGAQFFLIYNFECPDHFIACISIERYTQYNRIVNSMLVLLKMKLYYLLFN